MGLKSPKKKPVPFYKCVFGQISMTFSPQSHIFLKYQKVKDFDWQQGVKFPLLEVENCTEPSIISL